MLGGWPTLSLISTPEGALPLSRFLRQGEDFDFLSPPPLAGGWATSPASKYNVLNVGREENGGAPLLALFETWAAASAEGLELDARTYWRHGHLL
jgi:hypothetical protein